MSCRYVVKFVTPTKWSNFTSEMHNNFFFFTFSVLKNNHVMKRALQQLSTEECKYANMLILMMARFTIKSIQIMML